MEIDYGSDFSSISSAQSSTAEESNMEESEVNNDEIEDDQEFKYTIPFEKTETKRKRMAIKIGKETFVFKRYDKSKTIYWQCQFNKCPVSVTTLDDLGCLNNQTHVHDCLSEAEYKCLEIEEFVIQRAINEETPIPKLFCEELDNLVTSGLEHQQIAAYINFKQSNIIQKAYRAREKNGFKRVRTAQDIDLDNKYGLTTDGKPFVLFDSKDSDRIIRFCSPIGFEILKKTKQFYVDGTFKSTPKIYYQTYGIYCWLLNQMFPAVFILLSEKTERIYKKMLNLLKEACFSKDILLNPEILVTDFEMASINAFKFHFPGIKVVGCQFHFAQCIRRKVDTLGLKVPYTSNDDIQFFIKSFIALSMVPLSKIDDAFIILLENKSKLFEKLTIATTTSTTTTTATANNLLIVNTNRGRGQRGSRGQRGGRVGRGRGRGLPAITEPTSLTANIQDLTLNVDTVGNDYCKLIENFLTYFVDTWFEGNFESKLWNHAYTIGPRTNNHVEGFHNKLNKWIAKPHPNIYQLISVFQKIDTKIHIDYQTRLLGKSGPKRRAVDIEKDNRYQNLLENLEMNVIDLQQYLRSCSFLVNFNNIMNMV